MQHACDSLHHMEWTENCACPENMVYGPSQNVCHPYDVANKIFRCNKLVPVLRYHLQRKDLDLLPCAMQDRDALAKGWKA